MPQDMNWLPTYIHISGLYTIYVMMIGPCPDQRTLRFTSYSLAYAHYFGMFVCSDAHAHLRQNVVSTFPLDSHGH